MGHYQTLNLTDEFRIEIADSGGKDELSDHQKKQIEKIWAQERLLNPYLFNGKILSMVKMEGTTLKAEFIDYKDYFASVKEPSVHAMPIKPIGITGLTSAGDLILVGRRSGKVLMYPHFFDSVPSGSIDPSCLVNGKVDIKSQFSLELEEESGISSKDIQAIHPFLLIWDKEEKLIEVCAHLKLKEGINYPIQPTEEYEELRWVSTRDMKAFLERHSEQIVPLSAYLLHQFASK